MLHLLRAVDFFQETIKSELIYISLNFFKRTLLWSFGLLQGNVLETSSIYNFFQGFHALFPHSLESSPCTLNFLYFLFARHTHLTFNQPEHFLLQSAQLLGHQKTEELIWSFREDSNLRNKHVSSAFQLTWKAVRRRCLGIKNNERN